jgi:hypothetical protein
MHEKKYEENLNYPQLLLKRIDDIHRAIMEGRSGAVELALLKSILIPEIDKEIEPDLEKMENRYNKMRDGILQSWQGKSTPHGEQRTQMTPNRYNTLLSMEQAYNLQALKRIMVTLSKSELLLTTKTYMPTSLVR